VLSIYLLAWSIYLFGAGRVNKQGVSKDKIFLKTRAGKNERGYDMNV
jgi:hypothetical protein